MKNWLKYKFWSIIHNGVCHPLLIFNDRKNSWIGKFHDYTASKFEHF